MKPPSPTDRDSALTLLRDQHRFPGPYVFRIVVRPTVVSAVVSAVAAALGTGSSLESVDERVSRGGKYTAVHLHTIVATPEVVLDVYDVVSKLDNVLMSL